MADNTPTPPPSASGDRALPPVEPPSAGFLIQLFVIPGVIVVLIVVVWLLFHWLAAMGNDWRDYVKKLRGNSEMRWQAAVNLAGALQGEAGEDIKHDQAFAAELGQILADEIKAGGDEETQLRMRQFLCVAIGQFKIDAALDPLLNAANSQLVDDKATTKRAAVRGLASLAINLKHDQPNWADPRVVTALIENSKSDNGDLRSDSAFALGILGDEKSIARLSQMLDDEHADARYNAAVGLVRNGDAAALPVIKEMLDPNQELATKEEDEGNRSDKTRMIHITGLQALGELAKKNPGVDLQSTVEPVEQLTKSDFPDVRGKARELQQTLATRGKTN